MARVAAIAIFAGAVVLSTHILAPAEPAPAKPSISTAAIASTLAQNSTVVDQMNAQVEKLRERLSAPPPYPEPKRDPFRFGRAAEPTRPKPVAPAPIVEAPPAPPAPALPRLVAIMSNVVGGVTVRSAVLSVGDDVQIAKVGDKISALEIRRIDLDAVELADSSSGATFKISLH